MVTRKTKKRGEKGKSKKKRKKKDLFVLKYLTLAVISILVILFYVWERVERLEAGYRIRERVKRRGKLMEEKEVLLLEVVRLKSPQRLERIAREELGLIAPTGGKSIRRITVNHQ